MPPAFRLARVTANFLRAVPLAELRVETHCIKAGRSTQRWRAVLHADRPVLEMEGLFVRASDGMADLDSTAGPEWAAPESVAPFTFPFFQTEHGYHRAVDLRFWEQPWGPPRVRVWARPLQPLVAGWEDSPEQRVVLLTDAQSGMAPPLDPLRFNYPNPDLSLAFTRRPQGEWVGLDIQAQVGPEGIGLAHSRLRDLRGAVGVAEQSLIVRARK